MPYQTPYAASIPELVDQVVAGAWGPDPVTLFATGAFWVAQSTRFPGTQQKYRNYYLLLRSGATFGACCLEADQLDPVIAEQLAGECLADLLRDERMPVRVAALDAYLAAVRPHKDNPAATPYLLPFGDPPTRAVARDKAIASLLRIEPGQKVGLIGVVNPLVAAIEEQGGVCLPCDFNMEITQFGHVVTSDMEPVLADAEIVIATGMTMSNGSFDRLLTVARERSIPLLVYAQTGSAIAPCFLGNGVAGISAEPFPFSQFSGDPTPVYLYRSTAEVCDD